MSLATALSCQGVKTSQDADATTSADNQGYTSIKGKKALPNTQTEPPEVLLPFKNIVYHYQEESSSIFSASSP